MKEPCEIRPKLLGQLLTSDIDQTTLLERDVKLTIVPTIILDNSSYDEDILAV
jgi:hypothetical protein